MYRLSRWTLHLPLLALLVLAMALGCGRQSGPASSGPSSGIAAGAAEVVRQLAAPVGDTLQVKRTKGSLAWPDPSAKFWDEVPKAAVTLLAQPVITPRPSLVSTPTVEVAAVHDGERVAFWLRWADPERSEAGKLGEFSDAFALEFPIQSYLDTSVMMGGKGKPVQIFHWRAQYQRDAEHGKPDVKTIYPNAAVDMYAMDFKEAQGGTPAEKESFSPGRVTGNPQAYSKSGLDEIVAEGYATSAVQEGTSGKARGRWRDGHWTLVITRPLVVEGGSSLKESKSAAVAFAGWQGGQGEVGSRKCVTLSWLPLALEK